MWMTYAAAAAVEQRVDILIWLTFKSIVCGFGNVVFIPHRTAENQKTNSQKVTLGLHLFPGIYFCAATAIKIYAMH